MSISFSEHLIPSFSISAITRDRIYYSYKDALYSYILDTKTINCLAKVQNISHIFVHEKELCIIHGNKLVFCKDNGEKVQEEEKITLENVPLCVAEGNSGLLFLYESNRMESILYSSRKLRKVLVNGQETIKHISMTGSDGFILAKDCKIYRAPSIIDSGYVSIHNPIRIIPEPCGNFNKICAFEQSLFVITEDSVEKYKICEKMVVLEYSIEVENCTMIKNYLCGDETILMENAPYQLIQDRIYNISNNIALSATRIYFIKNEVVTASINSLDLEGFPKREITVNNVEIPSFIKNTPAEAGFYKNFSQIKKYTIIQTIVEEVAMSIGKRQEELKIMQEKILDSKSNIDKKKILISRRIAEIKSRAMKIAIGNTTDFYNNLRRLEEIISKFENDSSIEDLEEIKEKLKIQRKLLQEKLIIL